MKFIVFGTIVLPLYCWFVLERTGMSTVVSVGYLGGPCACALN